MPAALFLSSPWADISASHYPSGDHAHSFERNRKSDHVRGHARFCSGVGSHGGAALLKPVNFHLQLNIGLIDVAHQIFLRGDLMSCEYESGMPCMCHSQAVRRQRLTVSDYLTSARTVCTSPYVSPGGLANRDLTSFEGFPQTYIVSGEAECFIDEIRYLKSQMVESLGGSKVRYDEIVSALAILRASAPGSGSLSSTSRTCITGRRAARCAGVQDVGKAPRGRSREGIELVVRALSRGRSKQGQKRVGYHVDWHVYGPGRQEEMAGDQVPHRS